MRDNEVALLFHRLLHYLFGKVEAKQGPVKVLPRVPGKEPAIVIFFPEGQG
jgi:hypothetical protein